MPDIIETAVLSDNALLREGITKLLDGARFHVSQRTTSLDLQRYDSGQQAPDLFIIVIDDTSCSIVGDIKRQFKSAKIVALALRGSRELMHRAMQLGAVGYLVESVSAQDLITSLEVVIANGAVFPPELLSQLSEVAVEPQRLLQGVQRRADGSPFQGLSAREVSILEGLMLGESNKVIARKLEIAEATVKVHVKAILRKVRVRNRTQAAMWAMQNAVTRIPLVEEPDAVEDAPLPMIPARPDMAIASRHV
ncbi:response regulator transcription factor [Bosea sp. (in: a-proteobacteria)]|jgi:two-component system nitrate/nitrite response regulator NarL|uniref:LuxR C-terminal-related transcriptional regulator n=1 Tax=Bosea vestrisii TaxID=151416 RepID=A0ABW0HDP1_9HYPH|nr:response regulator transcription factor [Bosea sp. (in: a-proteobacteria)]MBR3193394.1 response regulator transcription factor [Bosea sp. (in: a-proteobacteria)]